MLTVFGSINLDVSVRSGHLPQPGETVLGRDALLSPGGKGANQAHAARRFGVPTRLFGKVGHDAFGAAALARLTEAGVALAGVEVSAANTTGLAMITVNEDGENTIIVAPGANHAVRASQDLLVTLCAGGSFLMQSDGPQVHVPALPVQAVDTTGAGDTYAGAQAAQPSRAAIDACMAEKTL